VAEKLREAGYLVYHPSLEGCAERSHALRADITLDTQGEPEHPRALAAEGAPELAEHALLGAEVLFGEAVREPLEKLTLLALEAFGHHDVDHHLEIAAAAGM